MQQEHGIRAARHSHADALPGFGRPEVKHAMSRDEFGYAVQHSVRMLKPPFSLAFVQALTRVPFPVSCPQIITL